MSLFERSGYRWRETYFVLFESTGIPSAEQIQAVLSQLSDRFEFSDLRTDEEGRFESATLLAPDDYAAIDISLMVGPEVIEQGEDLRAELEAMVTDDQGRQQLKRIATCDARFDVMHFEQVDADSSDDVDEMFDPSALLIALNALADLTGGVTVDPQSGTML